MASPRAGSKPVRAAKNPSILARVRRHFKDPDAHTTLVLVINLDEDGKLTDVEWKGSTECEWPEALAAIAAALEREALAQAAAGGKIDEAKAQIEQLGTRIADRLAEKGMGFLGKLIGLDAGGK